MRDRVTGEADECVNDLFGVVTGSPGIPERQRRDPVGVDVLGGAFQLRERGDRGPRLASQRMVDFQQQGLVRLDDQRSIGHFSPSSHDSSRPLDAQ